MDPKGTVDKETLAAHIEQISADHKHDGSHVVDKEAADLMAIAIKTSKLRHTSKASLQFYGFLFVAYCSKLILHFSDFFKFRLTSRNRLLGHRIRQLLVQRSEQQHSMARLL